MRFSRAVVGRSVLPLWRPILATSEYEASEMPAAVQGRRYAAKGVAQAAQIPNLRQRAGSSDYAIATISRMA
jgi:hypothetical protein